MLKPKPKVTRDDWDGANGWKIPSLTTTNLDAGLRPIEVGRAVASWVDIDNAILRIPKEQSSKNESHWQVSLSKRTATMLERWLEQRTTYPKYDDRDELWLTRHSVQFGGVESGTSEPL